ncbi:MAG TPA: hypothetical protein VGE12_21090 [Noviherbaspirillum sp.]
MLDVDAVENCRRSLVLLYATEIVREEETLRDRRKRFFGRDTLVAEMQVSLMHRTLLAAYDKLFTPAADIAA